MSLRRPHPSYTYHCPTTLPSTISHAIALDYHPWTMVPVVVIDSSSRVYLSTSIPSLSSKLVISNSTAQDRRPPILLVSYFRARHSSKSNHHAPKSNQITRDKKSSQEAGGKYYYR